MGFEHILIGELADRLQIGDRPRKIVEERSMLKFLDGSRYLQPRCIAKIATGFKITEWIKIHSYFARRYAP